MNVPTVLSNLPEPCRRRKSEYHYTIQIHLPVTSDISVYKAIFLKPERQLESVSMALKDFVFDARLAENSLAQWAAVVFPFAEVPQRLLRLTSPTRDSVRD